MPSGIVVKQDLDGAVFSLKGIGDEPTWAHTSTYSALAFVLASKREARFTYHLPSRAVIACEGGGIRGRGANIYAYRPVAGVKDQWAKQSVLQVEDGKGGAVLGLGCIKLDRELVLLVCLTENSLVLIRSI